MAKHQLSLNIVDGCNPTNFTIIDTSSYASNPISCPTLSITIPGYSGPIYFSQGTTPDPSSDTTDLYYPLVTVPSVYVGNPKFVFTIDNIFLKIQSPSETLLALPDGLYTIGYCVAPCDKLSVEYYYLRTTMALDKYASLLCKLRLSSCLPDESTLRMIDELHVIKMYLDAAKAKVEVCHAVNEGLLMYEYAIKLMNNWEAACCKNC